MFPKRMRPAPMQEHRGHTASPDPALGQGSRDQPPGYEEPGDDACVRQAGTNRPIKIRTLATISDQVTRGMRPEGL